LSGGGGLYIGDYVGISSFAQIYSHSETIKKGKKMSGPMIPESMKAFRSSPVTLENDSFVGAGAILLPGVTMGEGSVAGANSVITKSTEPWSIYTGNPAKKICRRP
jgi:acetyltransferase-like isoleucine patch superfamily enzyme